MSRSISTLLLPVAGMGTRLRPLTARKPKALVEVCGKPLLEYILDEAEEYGVRTAVLILNPAHERAFAAFLRRRGAHPRSKGVFCCKKMEIHFRFQRRPLGNGDALLAALPFADRAPVFLRFCDDIIIGANVLEKLRERYEELRAPVLALERIGKSVVQHYGAVSLKGGCRTLARGCRIAAIVEKSRQAYWLFPERVDPLAIVGAYVLTPRVFRTLADLAPLAPPLKDGFPFTAALYALLRQGYKIYGWKLQGRRFDCGTREGLQECEEFLCGKKS
ncbi:hypothetical protein D6779_01575 [Candidatus Parcubacteria bacterium]|nr:MAG: hypothetical protein D6779_01575 [Candidatus Parcubacteria bacterium]